jgi:O-methyltransferase
MKSKFGILHKLNFLQDFASLFIAGINPAVTHNLEKYYALKKVHYLSAIEHLEGDYLEFGVFTGSSFAHSIRCARKLNHFNSELNNIKFYGFDSFSGFGDVTEDDNHSYYIDQNFKTDFDRVNRRINNVCGNFNFTLVKGFFDQSLKNGPSALGIKKARIIFIDCDTYASAKKALIFCQTIIQQGTFIMLDDFFSYKGSERAGVARAFNEFIKRSGFSVRQVFTYGMGGSVYVISSLSK